MDKSLAPELRRAIRTSGLSAAKLAKQVGISQPTLSRFLCGADMSLSTADKLLRYFDYELTRRNGKK